MSILDKAKHLLGGHKEQAKTGVDKAADVVEAKTPDKYDDKVEQGAEKAKDVIDKVD